MIIECIDISVNNLGRSPTGGHQEIYSGFYKFPFRVLLFRSGFDLFRGSRTTQNKPYILPVVIYTFYCLVVVRLLRRVDIAAAYSIVSDLMILFLCVHIFLFNVAKDIIHVNYF